MKAGNSTWPSVPPTTMSHWPKELKITWPASWNTSSGPCREDSPMDPLR